MAKKKLTKKQVETQMSEEAAKQAAKPKSVGTVTITLFDNAQITSQHVGVDALVAVKMMQAIANQMLNGPIGTAQPEPE